MATRPPEELKATANQLAELLSSVDDGTRILHLAERLGFFGDEQEKAPEPPRAENSSPPESGRIGIWLPRKYRGQTVYVRDPQINPIEAGYWKDIEELPAKSHKKRVVYLGESVARGFFLDPYFCLTDELQAMLETAAPNEVEIIDLARSELGLWPLLRLARASLALQPDLIVIFAGNNWVTLNQSLQTELTRIASQLRERPDLRVLKEHIELWLSDQVIRFLDSLVRMGRDNDIPIIFVLPEFNLLDFKVRREAPPLLAEGSAGWHQAHAEARKALAGRDHETAKALATELIDLDGGMTPDSFVLRAACHLANGERTAARQDLESARDSEIWRWSTTPRCYRIIQQLIRDRAKRGEITLVDLPERFAEWQDNSLPDRRLFFDYCHLTNEGIRVAMASLAEKLLGHLRLAETDWHDLLDKGLSPPAEIVSRAHFMAAIHNASWGQQYELLHYHFQRAVELAPEQSGRLARILCEIAGIKTPALMSRAYLKLVELGDTHLLYRLATLGPYLYSELQDALIDSFGHLDPEIEETVKLVREENHEAGNGPLDLLGTHHCSSSWLQPESGWQHRHAFFKAARITSPFLFHCRKARPLDLKITCRLPGSGSARINLLLNGELLAEYEIEKAWRDLTLTIPPEKLKSGINTITIHWPLPPSSGETAIKQATNQLERGIKADFNGCLGEISTFIVKASS